MRHFLLPLILLTLINANAQYAEPVKDSLNSHVLAENRPVDIFLPTTYGKDTAHYDVWYVSDGEWNTRTFSVIANYLFEIGFAPRIIVVGVRNRYAETGYNYRDRDFTPVRSAEIDSSGGADRFLQFFSDELVPYINKKYRTTGESGIFGSSLGGVFVMHALLNRPQLFRYYAMADPALQFAGQYMQKVAAEKLPKLNAGDRSLHIGGRDGSSFTLMGHHTIDSVLRQYSPPGLHWKSVTYEDETHISSVFKSNYDGLKYAYLGYSAFHDELNPTGGIIIKDLPIRLFFPNEHADVRFSVDGTEPTRTSEKFVESMVVSNADKLRVKMFSPSGLYDRELPTHLKCGVFLTPTKLSRKSPKSHDGIRISHKTISAPIDGYYAFSFTQTPTIQYFFNDSSIVAQGISYDRRRETIFLPLRKGDYRVQVEEHLKPHEKSAADLIVIYSHDGQNDWKFLGSPFN